jgi:hypothetical protein
VKYPEGFSVSDNGGIFWHMQTKTATERQTWNATKHSQLFLITFQHQCMMG